MNEQNSNIKTEMDGMYIMILFLINVIKSCSNYFILIYLIHYLDTGLVVEEPDISETGSSAQKDEFSEILGSLGNLDSMVRETGNFVFILKMYTSIEGGFVCVFIFIWSNLDMLSKQTMFYVS